MRVIGFARGKARPLTEGEIREARKVFGERIDYAIPRIIDDTWTFFQGRGYVMSPDGHIYWPGCPVDCSVAGFSTMDVFIHEMTHVYQFQSGQHVVLRAGFLHVLRLASRALVARNLRYDPYRLSIDEAKPFHAYNLEQQAELAVAIYRQRRPDLRID